MQVSINWIKEFTELPKQEKPGDIAKKLTMSTCEVENITTPGKHLEEIVAAEITAVRPHPEADNLNLVTVNTGKTKKEVVCGAPNVKIGLVVPYAGTGTELPGGFVLEAKKIRGVVSEGMLCSEAELDLSDDHSGLMELKSGTSPGQTLAGYLKREADIVFDIDNKSITHRPDLWCHIGMARELAAVYRLPLKNRYDKDWMKKMESGCLAGKPPVTVTVEKGNACRVYYGLSVDNVSVGPSPLWMQQRLLSCGLRPINSIVDISNYVMLELGMPNHLFDRDTIMGGKVIIRKAGADKTFVTLDGIERGLQPDDTMVCDTGRPLVIAGIMGGLNSGVTEKTKNIFIEAANWQYGDIRRESSRLGLRTDSSIRYEKALDSSLCLRTVYRILELVLELNPEAKAAGPVVFDGEDTKPYAPKVDVSLAKMKSLLGMEIPPETAISILESLDFTVEKKGDLLRVQVPSFRATKDVECEADIIEEIGRVYGYDKIVPEPPVWRLETVRLPNPAIMTRRIRDYLVLHGNALEIMTYPLIGADLLKKAAWHEMNEELGFINPLSAEHDRMRPSLVPGFLSSVALNQKNYPAFTLFEMGRSYLPDPQAFSKEDENLIAGVYDRNELPMDTALDMLEGVLQFARIPFQLDPGAPSSNPHLCPNGWTGLHPDHTLTVRILGKENGFFTQVHPLLLREYKIKGNLFLFVLNLADVMDRDTIKREKYKQISRYPSSDFDCTVIAEPHIHAEEIIKAVKKLRLKELVSVRVVDVFQLDETRKTVTIRATFSDSEKTLTGEFLNEAQKKLVELLQNAGFPLKM